MQLVFTCYRALISNQGQSLCRYQFKTYYNSGSEILYSRKPITMNLLLFLQDDRLLTNINQVHNITQQEVVIRTDYIGLIKQYNLFCSTCLTLPVLYSQTVSGEDGWQKTYAVIIVFVFYVCLFFSVCFFVLVLVCLCVFFSRCSMV